MWETEFQHPLARGPPPLLLCRATVLGFSMGLPSGPDLNALLSSVLPSLEVGVVMKDEVLEVLPSQ